MPPCGCVRSSGLLLLCEWLLLLLLLPLLPGRGALLLLQLHARGDRARHRLVKLARVDVAPRGSAGGCAVLLVAADAAHGDGADAVLPLGHLLLGVRELLLRAPNNDVTHHDRVS